MRESGYKPFKKQHEWLQRELYFNKLRFQICFYVIS